MNNNIKIDINADVGEGIGNEVDLMPFLSSCNIACGGHAGDVKTMTEVVKLANKHHVKIGAHPSFPDKKNFGRIDMEISTAGLYYSLKQQILALQQVLYSENTILHHIKPHGALYNLAAKDEKTALVIVEVIKGITLPLKLYAPYNSVVASVAKAENIEVAYEAFADRNYNEDLSLVSRKTKNAMISDNEEILNHVLRMILQRKVRTNKGREMLLKASTFCVHGDTKNALEILKYLNQKLPQYNIDIQ
jgi:UPF0271 protein